MVVRAVAGVGLDADQDRVGVGGLEAGGVLEARRDHAVVVVGRGDHRGGVVRAVLQVVERGVAVEVVEWTLERPTAIPGIQPQPMVNLW